MDESDPLWIAVLKIAEGDRARAKKLIDSPEGLLKYPEVAALMVGGGDDGKEDDWEKDGANVGDLNIEEGESAPAAAVETVAAPVVVKAPEPVVEEEVVDEGDPREHINLVFIGHVDAGKSTLSGNILYLTDNVDKRTIERFQREAVERNRGERAKRSLARSEATSRSNTRRGNHAGL